jgi:hypothetical protein
VSPTCASVCKVGSRCGANSDCASGNCHSGTCGY